MMTAQARGASLPVGAPTRAARLAVLALASATAVLLGYSTFLPSVSVSLVWPLSGVGFLWLATSDRRRLPVDLVGLAVVVLAVLPLAGASAGQAVMAALMALVQPLVGVAVLRRLAPHLRGGGGRQPLSSPRDLTVLLAACVLGAAASALVRYAGLGLMPSGDGTTLVLTWVRNASWMLVIGALGLLVLPHLFPGTPDPRPWRARWAALLPTPRPAETFLIVAVTALLYAQVYSRTDPLPITFLLSLITVWAAARTGTVPATVYAAASGITSVVLTVAGKGVFYAIEDRRVGAALSEGFLVTLVLTALILALTSDERAAAIRRALRSERAAAERADMLTGVMESMREGIVVVQDDGTIFMRNPAGRRLIGFEHVEPAPYVMPPSSYGFVDEHGDPLSADQMPAALYFRGHDVVARDYRVRTPESPVGRILEMTVTGVATAPDAAHRRAIINFHDVTQERQDRDGLASFAGVVAHDLNNPLSVVSGWAEALADAFTEGPVDPADGTAMVARIEDASRHMRQFIDDLLTYTLARDHALRLDDVDLSDIAEGVAALRREGDSRPIIEVTPGLTARADVAMMRQLIDNLVGNATKYVGPGVRPRVCVDGESAHGRLHLRVSDNGIGVPAAMRERIFEDFQRAHVGEYAGTGIGLAICRRIVERHGGTIGVEPNPSGQGSRFVATLALPTTVSPTADRPLIAR